MSYDINVFTIKEHYSSNYTSNVWCTYQTAYNEVLKENKDKIKDLIWWVPDDFKDALNCENRECILLVLGGMITELKNNPDKYKAMNPKNGWGDYESAIEFLEDALATLAKYSESIMKIRN